jgi:hypothetical protein
VTAFSSPCIGPRWEVSAYKRSTLWVNQRTTASCIDAMLYEFNNI